MADGKVRGQVLRILGVVLGAAAQTHRRRRRVERREAEEEREKGGQGQDIATGSAETRRGKSVNLDSSHPLLGLLCLWFPVFSSVILPV